MLGRTHETSYAAATAVAAAKDDEAVAVVAIPLPPLRPLFFIKTPNTYLAPGGAIRKPAPTLIGEDNAQVLAGLGIDQARIEALMAADAVYRGPQRKRSGGDD